MYQADDVAFRLGPVPEHWHRLQADGMRVAFRDQASGVLVSVGGRCGKDGDDVPLSALTRHLFLYFTDRQLQNERMVNLDGREALRTELLAKLDGVPRHFVVYVLKKDGCVYDFLHLASEQNVASVAAFDGMVQGFSTLK